MYTTIYKSVHGNVYVYKSTHIGGPNLMLNGVVYTRRVVSGTNHKLLAIFARGSDCVIGYKQ